MSTRGRIFIKLRTEDKGKDLRIDINKVPLEHPKFREEYFTAIHIEKETNYLSIYNHWDSYCNNGLGQVLQESFHSYEEVLNLILGGNTSSLIGKYYRPYADEGDYFMQAPKQHNEINSKDIERVDFIYLYDDCQWWFTEVGYVDKWISLSWYINNH